MTKSTKQFVVITSLLVIFGVLQYTFWFGKNSVKTLKETQSLIAAENENIKELTKRNQNLTAEIVDLKSEGESKEERARMELGYIKTDEEFYRVVETDSALEYSKPVVEKIE